MRHDTENIAKKPASSWSTWLKEIVAEGAVIAAADFAAHPFGTVYTNQLKLSVASQQASAWKSCQQIKAEGGIRGLYAGFFIGSIVSLPGAFAYFHARDLALLYCGDNYFGQAMQGACGVAAGTVFWAPTGRICTLLQVSKNSADQSTLFSELKHMWKEKGVAGFYRGAGPIALSAMAGDALASLIQAQTVKCYPASQQKEFNVQFKATWLAYGLATIFLSPLDVSIAYMRMVKSNVPDKAFIPTVKIIYARSGIRGFFGGLPAAILHAQVEHSSLAYMEHTK